MAKQNKTIASIQSEYMKNYQLQQERKIRRKKALKRRLIVATMLMLTISGVVVNYHFNQRALYSEKQAQYDELTQQLAQLEKEERELLEEIDLLKDDEYILDIARTNYFLSKEGELIFQLHEEQEY